MFSGAETEHIYSASIFSLERESDAELVRNVETLKKQVRLLRLENEVLEASIMRLQPSLMTGAYATLESALRFKQTIGSRTTLASVSKTSKLYVSSDQSVSIADNLKSKSRMLQWKESSIKPVSSVRLQSRSMLGTALPKVNVEEKLELVHTVMKILGKDLKKARMEAKKRHCYLKAQLEEIDLRTTEFEKCTTEFEQEVMIAGVDAMTKRIPAEIWIRFLTEHVRKIDIQIGKLLLRTNAANTQHKALKVDIKRKQDLTEHLVPVDFEVKKIQIQEALKKIDNKNRDVIKQKALTGAANLNLTGHKYRMMDLMKYHNRVKNMTAQKKRQTVELDAERAKMAIQVEKFRKELDTIRNLREAFFTPDMFEYIALKLKICGIKQSVERLETSLNLKKYAITSYKKELWKSKMLFSKIDLGSKEEEPSKTVKENEVELESTELVETKICRPCGLLLRE